MAGAALAALSTPAGLEHPGYGMAKITLLTKHAYSPR